jgi:hypothetical protein
MGMDPASQRLAFPSKVRAFAEHKARKVVMID